MFELFCEHAQCQHFSLGHGLVGRCAVGQNPRQLRDFGQPATIFFAIAFEIEFHSVPLDEAKSVATRTMRPKR